MSWCTIYVSCLPGKQFWGRWPSTVNNSNRHHFGHRALPLAANSINNDLLRQNYNKEYRCRQHKYAIPSKSIEKHLRDRHPGIPLSARQEILEYARSVILYEPKDVVYSIGN